MFFDQFAIVAQLARAADL